MSYIAETITLDHGVTVKIIADDNAESPTEWCRLGEITYRADSRYTLGTEPVTQDRFEEIVEGIKNGSLIGLPVYAYVHSGATIRCGSSNPFSGYDPGGWDSGLSGVVYCTREKALKEFGKKLLTKKVRERALDCLRCEVETFDQYLTGDVWGVVVEVDGVEVDSCWGFYGSKYAKEEALSMGKCQVEEQIKEEKERAEWEARDVVTQV